MYRTELHCCDVVEWEGGRAEVVEGGGKALLPPTVLEDLVSRWAHLPTPLVFQLTPAPTEHSVPGVEDGPSTHVGVLEFVANPGTIVLPSWVISQLRVSPGDIISVSLSVSLPMATFARFKPQSSRFLSITDPKAVLENSLRKFTCLTTGDIFHIDYNNQVYRIEVEETKPAPAVTIIECDMEVEFSPPDDYVEPTIPQPEVVIPESEPATVGFVPFTGVGQRLDGKPFSADSSSAPHRTPQIQRVAIPDYDYVPDGIQFMRNPPIIKRSINGHLCEE